MASTGEGPHIMKCPYHGHFKARECLDLDKAIGDPVKMNDIRVAASNIVLNSIRKEGRGEKPLSSVLIGD
jgi:hypothetical protein